MMPDRSAEIAELVPLYGEPLYRSQTLEVSASNVEWWFGKRSRQEEVVMFLLRANGMLLLHTKGFYPCGAFRVLSGGIQRGERLLDAVHREGREETGLEVQVERLLTVIDFRFCRNELSRALRSYSFLVHEAGGSFGAQDLHEGITEYREIALQGLPAVADQLARLAEPWSDWGAFRALPHRLAAEILLGSRPGIASGRAVGP